MEKQIEKELDKILNEAHAETQRETRRRKLTSKIVNPEFEVKPIAKTPFAILKENEKNEIWIILGNEKIKQVSSEKEAITQTKKYDWDILGPTIYKIAIDATIKTLERINH